MIDLGIKENLKKLKAKVMGGDYDPSALDQVEEWEKRVMELSDREDFTRLETTKAIALELKGRIKEYYNQRATTRDQEKLLTLDSKIEEDKFLARLLCANPNEEIQEISDLVLQELSQ